MAIRYLENPILFLNSSTSAIPTGRNARAHSRAQEAKANAPLKAQQGRFHVLNMAAKRPPAKDDSSHRKRRKQVDDAADQLQLLGPDHKQPGGPPIRSLCIPRALPDPIEPRLDPADILTVATFHIRRLAAMIVRTDPSRLPDVLRCRQWSCVPSALDRFGKSPCLDSALICVATKLQQMTGRPVSELTVLSKYSDALHGLQSALQEPDSHDRLDLLSTTQLLAVYEMLGSIDEPAWTQHIAGAASLVHPSEFSTQTSHGIDKFSFSQVAPILTELLLKDDVDALERCSGKLAFAEFLQHDISLTEPHRALLRCLLEVPTLLIDTRAVREHQDTVTAAQLFTLMGRAHMLRDKLRTGIFANDFQPHTSSSIPGSFDMLAMCLAGMVALDRLITALKPVETRAESAADRVNELCAQLLQLELGASDSAYPATDLMSAFALSSYQQQSGYVIVLPGKGYT